MISTNLKDSAKGPLKASDRAKLSTHGSTIDLKITYKNNTMRLKMYHHYFKCIKN